MLNRLKLLEENVKELFEFKKRFKEEVMADKPKEWALRYGLLGLF